MCMGIFSVLYIFTRMCEIVWPSFINSTDYLILACVHGDGVKRVIYKPQLFMDKAGHQV